MEIYYWQLTFMICLFCLALIGSFWPLIALKMKMKGDSKNVEDFKDSKVISLGNSLACGLFFALCFLHLIPHSAHKWETIFSSQNQTMETMDHPQNFYSSILPQCLILISFTMMLLIEKTELICKQKSCESLPIIVLTKASEEEEPSVGMSKSLEDITNEEDSASFHQDYISFGDLQLVSDNPKQYGALRSMSMVSGSALNVSKIRSKSVILSNDKGEMGGKQVAFFIFGLAFHNLLEGLTLGLQNEPSAAFSLFIAILIHAGFLATAATTTLLHFWLPLDLSFYSMSLYLLLLCLVRPVGILLGLIVLQIPGVLAMIIAATLQSLSTGVFIYITFMSLIPEEYHRSQSESQTKISYKVAAFTLGWATLVLLTLATQ